MDEDFCISEYWLLTDSDQAWSVNYDQLGSAFNYSFDPVPIAEPVIETAEPISEFFESSFKPSQLTLDKMEDRLFETESTIPDEPAISQPNATESFFCPEGCLKPFKRSYEVNRHIREQHLCPHEDCKDIRFPTPKDRKNHEKMHSEGGLGYRCGSCELSGYPVKALPRPYKLAKHFKDIHKTPGQFDYREFQCKEQPCYVSDSCGGIFFISLGELKKHTSSKHSKPESGPSKSPNEPTSIGKHALDQKPESTTKRLKEHGYVKAGSQWEISPRRSDNMTSLRDSSNWVEKKAQQTSAQPPPSIFGNNPSTNTSCQSNHYGRTLVQPIKMIELWDLVKHYDFPSVIAQLQSIHISPIFNKSRKSIELRGPCSLDDMEKGKNLLEPLIHMVRRKSLQKDKTETPTCRGAKTRFRNKRLAAGQPKIFAIDPAEDKEAINTWRNHIRPRLRDVVGDLPIGDTYTATLVRQKSDHGVLIPLIRFQSSAGQARLTRNIIRHKISHLCKKNNRPEIQVQFSQGAMVRLVGGNSSQSIDDDPPSDSKFPHQCRYFQKPGMGASIGMSQCAHISATLGGYILINGIQHMLTVDHFIWEARECPECRLNNQTNSLNSPSPSDVNDIKTFLDRVLGELELGIVHAATDEDIPLSQVADLFTEELRGMLEQYTRFRQDLEKTSEQFELGKLVQRSGLDSFKAPTIRREGGDNVISHRMDWAVFMVNGQRQGMNKHRHPTGAEPGLQDFKNEITNPEGTGTPCEGSREFQATEVVYYVGNFSGFREGTVNAEPVVVIDEHGQRMSQEWAIIPSGSQEVDENDVCGDSGAWVLGNDNKLLGLLWGYDNHLLLFTPIGEVFADISRAINDASVDVARLNMRLISQGISWISRKQSLLNTLGAPRFTNLLPRKQLLLTNESTATPNLVAAVDREKSSPGSEAQGSTTSEISGNRSPSPVPSLTSSVASLSDASSPELRPLDSPAQLLGDLADMTGRLAINPKGRTVTALPSHTHVVLDLQVLA